MKYKYYICDVFSEKRFGGNQLVVLPEATGLSDVQMQLITREFNFSESTFVFPAKQANTRSVRIFTPTTEIPFAGHPNVGTAFVLASTGVLDDFDSTLEIRFEGKAGIVPVLIKRMENSQLWCELKAPQALSLGKAVAIETVASAVSLCPDDIVTSNHAPIQASVGLPFLMTELRDMAALGRAKIDLDGFDEIQALGIVPDIHLYVQSVDEFDLRTRMFAPLDGVPEDPATGSANCALTGLLAYLDEVKTAQFSYRIAQGVEMGRPSVLESRAEKIDGEVVSTWIGGYCAMVSEGIIFVE